MPNRPQWNRCLVGFALALILGLLLAVLGYVYRGQLLSILDLVDEVTGSRTLTLLGVCLGLFTIFCGILWMLLPIIVYLGLKDLGHRTTELEQSLRRCADHLAQLTDNRALPPAPAAPEEQPTDHPTR